MIRLATRHRLLTGLLLASLALPLAAATPELDPLAREIEAFAGGQAKTGAKSLELSARLAFSEKVARDETQPALRAELRARLAGLREKLGTAGRSAGVAGDSEAIAALGTFSGQVTHDGEPVAQAEVYAYLPDGSYRFYATTQSDGRYTLVVDPGTYALYVNPLRADLSSQLYDGINCLIYNSVECDPALATLLQLPSGGHVVANFSLIDRGRIEGRVRARETLAPIDTGHVFLFNEQGAYVNHAGIAAGTYEFSGILPGRYYVTAVIGGDRVGMIYRDVNCYQPRFEYFLQCPTEGATLVTVALEQVVSGIDFDLYRGASFTGRVFDAHNLLNVPHASVAAITADFHTIATAQVDETDGTFEIEGLAPGRYYLEASAANGYTPQFYQLANCAGQPYCLAAAKSFVVVVEQTISGLEFPLEKTGTLSGSVSDTATGAALPYTTVQVLPKGSDIVYRETQTDSAGFFSFSDLPSVEMLIRAEHLSYVPEYYENVDARLGPATAKSIKIESGHIVSGIHLRLEKRGNLQGRAIDSVGGEAVRCYVEVLEVGASTSNHDIRACNPDGSFEYLDLLPGRYYLHFYNYYSDNGHAHYLYGKGSCNFAPFSSRCRLSEGTPVEIGSGQTTSLEIRLEREATLRSDVTFDLSGSLPPSPGAALRLFESDGDPVVTYLVDDPVEHQLFTQLAPGKYRLIADGSPNWQSFVWNGVPCGRWYCDPRRGEEIVLGLGEEKDVAFELSPIPPYTGCTPSETVLCLNQGRYEIKATWKDFLGATGPGTARTLTADTGYFYFFGPDNLELMVKALNACDDRLGHHFWIYAAGLTNVQVELRARDTLTGAVRTYTNALGNTFLPILDSSAFATCDAVLPPAPATSAENEAAAANVASALAPREAEAAVSPFLPPAGYCDDHPYDPLTSLCLGGRFLVRATFLAPDGWQGLAGSHPITSDTGGFYFFSGNNLELVVKVLDACSTVLPGYWVFASGLTDVQVDLSVEDLATGETVVYPRGPGPYQPVLDLGAFPCD